MSKIGPAIGLYSNDIGRQLGVDENTWHSSSPGVPCSSLNDQTRYAPWASPLHVSVVWYWQRRLNTSLRDLIPDWSLPSHIELYRGWRHDIVNPTRGVCSWQTYRRRLISGVPPCLEWGWNHHSRLTTGLLRPCGVIIESQTKRRWYSPMERGWDVEDHGSNDQS